MARKKHRIRKIVGSILAVVIVLLVAAFFLRDMIIKNAVETFGSKITGTAVKIGGFRSSISGASVKITDFALANPSDSKNPEAIKFNQLLVEVDFSSIFSDEIIIKKIEIDGCAVDYEPSLMGKSNFEQILDNIRTNTASAGKQEAAPAKEKPAEPPKDEKKKKLVIEYFIMTNTSITVASSSLATDVKVPMATLELRNIGRGKSMDQTVLELYEKLMAAILNTVKAANIPGLGDIGKKLKKLDFEAPAQIIDSGTEQVKKSVDDVSNKIKNLF